MVLGTRERKYGAEIGHEEGQLNRSGKMEEVVVGVAKKQIGRIILGGLYLTLKIVSRA